MWLQTWHNQKYLVKAKAECDEKKVKGIKAVIEQEEKITMWSTINSDVDDPKLGTTSKVQFQVNGAIVDITDKAKMAENIQQVTEKRFKLDQSASYTFSSLYVKLGCLLDTEFVKKLLGN